MVGKTLTGVPKFSVGFSGKVDRSYAGRQVFVYFGDSQISIKQAAATIGPDGSFSVLYQFAFANPSIVPLYQIRID